MLNCGILYLATESRRFPAPQGKVSPGLAETETGSVDACILEAEMV